jgi:hypothetical protein
MGVGFSTSDRRDWEFLRGYMHPEAVVDLTRAGGWRLGLEAEYGGLEGYVRWFETFTEAWADFSTDDIEVVAPRGNRVVVLVRPRAKGVGSGIDIAGELATVFTYDRGWLVRIEGFAESDEALARVGLQRRPRASVT